MDISYLLESGATPDCGCSGGAERVGHATDHSAQRDSPLKSNTAPDECAHNPNRKPGEPCSSPAVIETIADFLSATDRSSTDRSATERSAKSGAGAAPIESVAELLQCDSESCVVQHPKIRAHARKMGTDEQIAEDLETRFKPPGPRNTTQLTSNFDLDAVLRQWANTEFPDFFPYPFAMIDFAETGGSLATIDPADVIRGSVPVSIGLSRRATDRRPCKVMGCVINTDYSTGPGKHWVAVCIDARPAGTAQDPWRVEFFNSSGNPPPPQVARWMEKTRDHLEREFNVKVVDEAVSRLRHQKSRTECGLYSLYFLRRRCEGAPASEFRKTEIPDAAMTEFRKHVFRHK